MARIEVNHQTLRNVASAISSYCSEQEKQMKIADQSVKALTSSYWSGFDAEAYADKWKGVNTDGSAAYQFKKSLENFASILNACAESYRSAQEKTYNAACRLPKF